MNANPKFFKYYPKCCHVLTLSNRLLSGLRTLRGSELVHDKIAKAGHYIIKYSLGIGHLHVMRKMRAGLWNGNDQIGFPAGTLRRKQDDAAVFLSQFRAVSQYFLNRCTGIRYNQRNIFCISTAAVDLPVRPGCISDHSRYAKFGEHLTQRKRGNAVCSIQVQSLRVEETLIQSVRGGWRRFKVNPLVKTNFCHFLSWI